MLPDLHAQPGINVSGPALRWRAVRSSGPGGQNVNKVASKVELRVLVVSLCGLTSATRERRTMARLSEKRRTAQRKQLRRERED